MLSELTRGKLFDEYHGKTVDVNIYVASKSEQSEEDEPKERLYSDLGGQKT